MVVLVLVIHLKVVCFIGESKMFDFKLPAVFLLDDLVPVVTVCLPPIRGTVDVVAGGSTVVTVGSQSEGKLSDTAECLAVTGGILLAGGLLEL